MQHVYRLELHKDKVAIKKFVVLRNVGLGPGRWCEAVGNRSQRAYMSDIALRNPVTVNEDGVIGNPWGTTRRELINQYLEALADQEYLLDDQLNSIRYYQTLAHEYLDTHFTD